EIEQCRHQPRVDAREQCLGEWSAATKEQCCPECREDPRSSEGGGERHAGISANRSRVVNDEGGRAACPIARRRGGSGWAMHDILTGCSYTEGMRTSRICSAKVGLFLAAGVIGLLSSVAASAQDAAATVPQTWQMIDYLSTDYAGAIKDGSVISASEYSEMREFSRTAKSRIQALPPSASSASLLAQANTLIAQIDAKASPADVARSAHTLADALLAAYPIATGPQRAPDLGRGAALYQQQCAACHGPTGKGDGPVGVRLSPPPVNFTAQARADERSALSLYEVITQGVQGTPMASYGKKLSAQSRWDLAYYVGTLAYPEGQSDSAARFWQRDTRARARITDLNDLSQARVTQLAPELGLPKSRLVVGYLRAHPDALQEALHGIPLARARLQASLAAYRAGSVAESTGMALSAYLDGIEPIEPELNARDGALR